MDWNTGISLSVVFSAAVVVWKMGVLQGSITQMLKELKTITADHESRLRKLEGEDK